MLDRKTAGLVALGAVAVIGAMAWMRTRQVAASTAQPGDSSYSWLTTSGSAEAIFNRPYFNAQGRPDTKNIDWDAFIAMNPGRPVFGRG